MKIKVETLEEVLGEVETEERFEIIIPFLKKISELEEKNEALNEALEETKKELERFKGTELINEELRRENRLIHDSLNSLEPKFNVLKDENEILESNNKGLQNKISKIRNIIKSIEDGISIETLYENIKGIGDLIDSDLSEQIEIIKTINENFREGQKEIKTLRIDKERIGILLAQFQKENETLNEKLNKSEEYRQKLYSELLVKKEGIDRLKRENDDLTERIRKFEENKSVNLKIQTENFQGNC